MRKTDKKIENALRVVLTEVCDAAQRQYEGFEWLTHFVNYDDFPGSLSVICVYDTNENLSESDLTGVRSLIFEKLIAIDIKLKDVRRQVRFDTEENCKSEHNGKWHERFK
jgi:hypothetical protein